MLEKCVFMVMKMAVRHLMQNAIRRSRVIPYRARLSIQSVRSVKVRGSANSAGTALSRIPLPFAGRRNLFVQEKSPDQILDK